MRPRANADPVSDGAEDSASQILEASVHRLASEWREARSAAGIPIGAAWSKVAAALALDRGTAQRLVRLASLERFVPGDLDYVPGTAGWQKVLSGIERTLGAEHPALVRLSLACDRFEEALGHFGGSKAAAKRALDAGEGRAASPIAVQRAERKDAWIEAAAGYIGSRVERRVDLVFARCSPETPGAVDITMVIVSQGCRGEPWALPFTLARFASQDGDTPLQSSGGPRFRVLDSVTSSPPPAILTTGDAERQTVFIEPSWTETHRSLDVGIMLTSEATMPLPWLDDPKQLVLTALMRQPAMTFHNECYLDPRLAARSSVASYSAYRDLSVLGSTRHWFDRLPETAEIRRLEAFAPRAADAPFDGYDDLVAEVRRRLDWDLDGFAGYAATVDRPIPFARYSMEFDCRED